LLRLLWLVALSGCASVGPYALFRSTTANPDHDNRVMADYEVHKNNPVYADVTVIESDGKESLTIAEGNLAKFRGADLEVIGKFDLKPDSYTPWTFANYSSLPRKLLCWPQVPLMWITLGVWIAVPTSYFCWSRTPGKRDAWMAWIKQLVDSAGGDAGVVTFTGAGDEIETVSGYVVRTR
jgi:hypothetical protein